jgi:ribosomal-protein-alanine N-acetyltransferase
MPVDRKLYARKLYLSRLGKKDAPVFYSLLKQNAKLISLWLPAMPKSFSIASVQNWIRQEHTSLKAGKRLDMGIFSYDNKLIGRIALHSIEMGVSRSAGLSYWIDHDLQRQGLTTMAVATLLSFAFEELQLHRIWACIIPENIASVRVCEKLGFRCEGVNSKSLFINNRWQNTSLMAMLETEYDSFAKNWIKSGFLGC